MSIRLNIYYGDIVYKIYANKTDSINNLFLQTNIPEDIVVFSAPPSEPHKTPIVDLSKTLVDYNMWFLEKSYIAELTVYNKTDNYDKELYEMYLEAAKETI
jgi:hypothetical protein